MSSRTALGQNARPTTAAACRAAFWVAGRRSILGASTACTVSGTRVSPGRRRLAPSPLAQRAALDQRAEQLLEEERIALRAVEQRRGPARGASPGDQLAQPAVDVVRPSGSSHSHALGTRPLPQVGLCSRNSGRAGRDEEDRRVHLAQHALQQLDERLLGPVDILDEQDERLLGRELGDEVEPRVVQAVARLDRVQLARDVEAESEPEDGAFAEHAEDSLRRVAVEQAEVLPDDLAERPVRTGRPVGRTAAGATQRLRRLGAAPRPELAQQTRLADARLTHDRDGLGPAGRARALVRLAQLRELGVAADERGAQAGEPARAHEGERADELPARHTFRLALRLDAHRGVELERPGDQRGGSFADEDLARVGGLLEPRGHVDGVPGDERAPLAGPADHHLARVDAYAQGESAAEVVRQPAPHRERGVQGPLDVVLVRRRDAERGHDRVAGELLDGAAGSLDLVRHRVVEAIEQRARALGVLRSAERRGADEVGEQRGGELALRAIGVRCHARRMWVNPTRGGSRSAAVAGSW